jgi:hypothetical protein
MHPASCLIGKLFVGRVKGVKGATVFVVVLVVDENGNGWSRTNRVESEARQGRIRQEAFELHALLWRMQSVMVLVLMLA